MAGFLMRNWTDILQKAGSICSGMNKNATDPVEESAADGFIVFYIRKMIHLRC